MEEEDDGAAGVEPPLQALAGLLGRQRVGVAWLRPDLVDERRETAVAVLLAGLDGLLAAGAPHVGQTQPEAALDERVRDRHDVAHVADPAAAFGGEVVLGSGEEPVPAAVLECELLQVGDRLFQVRDGRDSGFQGGVSGHGAAPPRGLVGGVDEALFVESGELVRLDHLARGRGDGVGEHQGVGPVR